MFHQRMVATTVGNYLMYSLGLLGEKKKTDQGDDNDNVQ